MTFGSANAALYTLNGGTTASAAAGVETMEGRTFRSGTTDGTAFTGTNAGVSAGPGIVAFGIFSTDNFSGVLDGAGLVSLFTQFGSTSYSFASGGTSGQRSIFSIPQSAKITDSAFANKAVYFFAGNGTTFAGSTQFLIAKMDTITFVPGDDTANATAPKIISINPANSTALLGSEVANVWTTNSDATQTPGWQMATLIPETSTALLGALGALGLLRRRR